MKPMAGKIIVITGPTSGIGREKAVGLAGLGAGLGAGLVLGCRDGEVEERLWSICKSLTRDGGRR